MYTDGTARWNLRIPCSGKCNHVSGGIGSRNCNFSDITRSTQKENYIKIIVKYRFVRRDVDRPVKNE